jgi:hypothetical protein
VLDSEFSHYQIPREKDAGTAAADSERTEELCLAVQRHLDLPLAHRVDGGEGAGSGL